jgi:hypothetical protein
MGGNGEDFFFVGSEGVDAKKIGYRLGIFRICVGCLAGGGRSATTMRTDLSGFKWTFTRERR